MHPKEKGTNLELGSLSPAPFSIHKIKSPNEKDGSRRNSYHKQKQSSIDDLGSSGDHKNLLDSPTNTRAELNSKPTSAKSVRSNSNDKPGCGNNEDKGNGKDKASNGNSRRNSVDSNSSKGSKESKNEKNSKVKNENDSDKKDKSDKSRKNSVDSSSSKDKASPKNKSEKNKAASTDSKGKESSSKKCEPEAKESVKKPKTTVKQWIGRGLLVALTAGSIYMILAISMNSQAPEQWPWGFWYVFALLFDLGIFQPLFSLCKFGLLLRFIKKPQLNKTPDWLTKNIIGQDILNIFSPKSGNTTQQNK